MGWFGFGKEREVIDLSERYRKLKEKRTQAQEQTESQESPVEKGFGFLAGLASSVKTPEQEPVPPQKISEAEERKKRLAKRLSDMTNKIDDLSSQIYRLQQRIEVLERKAGVSGFE